MKVALFGGSFNPFHNGHLQIANKLIDGKIVDEVWFIPCGSHPFGKELIKGEDRLNMIKFGINNNPKMKILDLEILSEKISFTSETIKFLRNKFKKIEFYFIIGADNLINLQKWHNFNYLKNNVKFILVKRPKFKLTNNFRIKIIYTLEKGSEISSAKIRNLVSKCCSVTDLVPEKVKNYIKQEDLYHDRPLCKSR